MSRCGTAKAKSDHDVSPSPRNETPSRVPVNIDSRHTANKVIEDAGLPKAF